MTGNVADVTKETVKIFVLWLLINNLLKRKDKQIEKEMNHGILNCQQ